MLIDLCDVLKINFVNLLILANYLPLSYADDELKELIINKRRLDKENSNKHICHFCPFRYFEGSHYER